MTATVLALRRRIEAEQVATMEKMAAALVMLTEWATVLEAENRHLAGRVARLEERQGGSR